MAHRKQNFVAIIALSVLAAGCGKDKTLDDYNREQSNKELAQAQAAAGNFRGMLTNQATNQALCPIEFDIQATQVPVQNGSNTGNVARAVLQGSVTITCASASGQGTITSASFTPADDSNTSGVVSGTVSVPLGTGGTGSSTATFSILANLNQGTLTGTLTPGTPGIIGSFSATRDAPLPRGGQGSTDPNGRGAIQTYAGTYVNKFCLDPQFKNTNLCKNVDPNHMPVSVTLNFSPANSGSTFQNLFANEKSITVDIKMGLHIYTLQNTAYNQSARSNNLAFNGTLPGDTSSTQFNCDRLGADGFSCHYMNAGQTYDFNISPAQAQ